MTKFVILPQHYQNKPIAVNVDKIDFIGHSTVHYGGSRITLDRDSNIEIPIHFESLVALLNGVELITDAEPQNV